ncbi:hypothetical protein [Methylobacterium aquaticum]|nr:hypothetical protein [Methylobacterium aquaticum]
MLLAAGLILALRPTPRETSAAMLAFLWQVPALLALDGAPIGRVTPW